MIHEIVPVDNPGEYQMSMQVWEEVMACTADFREQGKIDVMTLKDAAAMVPDLGL